MNKETGFEIGSIIGDKSSLGPHAIVSVCSNFKMLENNGSRTAGYEYSWTILSRKDIKELIMMTQRLFNMDIILIRCGEGIEVLAGSAEEINRRYL